MNNDNQREQILNPSATRLGVGYTLQADPEGGNPRTRLNLLFGTPTEIASVAEPLNLHNLLDADAMPISNLTIPVGRRATNAERQAWIDEFNAMGGMTDFEREVARLVNEVRVSYGLNPLTLNINMTMAARYYTQMLIEMGFRTGGGMGTAHTQGPYGGSRGLAESFGVNVVGGNAFTPGPNTPQALVDGWMNSPAHRNFILRPGHRYIGPGTSISPDSRGFSYLIMGS
jgi:uncharacterized protein YkwD